MTASPSKRAFTDSAREAIVASNTHHSNLSDDLVVRLQNIGSRVRKSVLEGYPSTTPTPNPSPAKGATVSVPLFRTSNEILREVFSSPSSSSSFSISSYVTPVSSPKKRAREEVEGADIRLRIQGLAGIHGPTLTDPESDDDDDDDDIEFITQSDESDRSFGRRPIRPLRKSRHVSASIPIGAGSFNAHTGEGIFDVPHTNDISKIDDHCMDIFD